MEKRFYIKLKDVYLPLLSYAKLLSHTSYLKYVPEIQSFKFGLKQTVSEDDVLLFKKVTPTDILVMFNVIPVEEKKYYIQVSQFKNMIPFFAYVNVEEDGNHFTLDSRVIKTTASTIFTEDQATKFCETNGIDEYSLEEVL